MLLSRPLRDVAAPALARTPDNVAVRPGTATDMAMLQRLAVDGAATRKRCPRIAVTVQHEPCVMMKSSRQSVALYGSPPRASQQ